MPKLGKVRLSDSTPNLQAILDGKPLYRHPAPRRAETGSITDVRHPETRRLVIGAYETDECEGTSCLPT